jgi:hypothetical protein
MMVHLHSGEAWKMVRKLCRFVDAQAMYPVLPLGANCRIA